MKSPLPPKPGDHTIPDDGHVFLHAPGFRSDSDPSHFDLRVWLLDETGSIWFDLGEFDFSSMPSGVDPVEWRKLLDGFWDRIHEAQDNDFDPIDDDYYLDRGVKTVVA